MRNRSTSDLLFARPSLVSGAARLLDLYALFDSYTSSLSEAEADYKALLGDWYSVGQDIQYAIGAFESSLPPESLAASQYDLFTTTAQ